jgi:hypothetical protein
VLNKKEQALKLRLKGCSYNEINKKLGIPKSTLSGWFKNIVLSKEAQTRLNNRITEGGLSTLIKRNKMQTYLAQARAKENSRKAEREIRKISKYELCILGAALYWTEGYKKLKVIDGKERTSHTISFLNVDPYMIRLFIRFLKETLEIKKEDIKAIMRIYKGINEQVALKYWSGVTELNEKNFRKPLYLISLSSFGKRPFNRLPYGTLQLEVASTEKFHYLLGLIEGIKKMV